MIGRVTVASKPQGTAWKTPRSWAPLPTFMAAGQQVKASVTLSMNSTQDTKCQLITGLRLSRHGAWPSFDLRMEQTRRRGEDTIPWCLMLRRQVHRLALGTMHDVPRHGRPISNQPIQAGIGQSPSATASSQVRDLQRAILIIPICTPPSCLPGHSGLGEASPVSPLGYMQQGEPRDPARGTT